MELDNVRVLHALQHLQLIVHHLLVAPDIFLQDDFDSDLAFRALGLSDNAVCSSTQCFAEPVS